MEPVLDLTENQIGCLTESEANEILENLQDLQVKILYIEGKVRARMLDIGGRKCKSCGATSGYLRVRRDGTYFCLKCGFSTGGPT